MTTDSLQDHSEHLYEYDWISQSAGSWSADCQWAALRWMCETADSCSAVRGAWLLCSAWVNEPLLQWTSNFIHPIWIPPDLFIYRASNCLGNPMSFISSVYKHESLSIFSLCFTVFCSLYLAICEHCLRRCLKPKARKSKHYYRSHWFSGQSPPAALRSESSYTFSAQRKWGAPVQWCKCVQYCSHIMKTPCSPWWFSRGNFKVRYWPFWKLGVGNSTWRASLASSFHRFTLKNSRS